MTSKGPIRIPAGRRLALVVATGAALGLWALAAAHGYAWEMIWLPATVAGAAWPRNRKAHARPMPQAARVAISVKTRHSKGEVSQEDPDPTAR